MTNTARLWLERAVRLFVVFWLVGAGGVGRELIGSPYVARLKRRDDDHRHFRHRFGHGVGDGSPAGAAAIAADAARTEW